MRVLDAARIVPSASNRQPTRLVLVTAREAREKLPAMCGQQPFIATAPMVVAGCGRGCRLRSGSRKADYTVIVDAAIAMDHLTLAARAEGLGTCWIGVLGSTEVKEYLRLPEDADVIAVTPLGYPEGEAFGAPGDRLPMDEFIRWETWGEDSGRDDG